jgi:hypothetical protein
VGVGDSLLPAFIGVLSPAAAALQSARPMHTTSRLGTFVLNSSAIVVMDPGYDIQAAEMPLGGCLVRSCRAGSWSLSVTWDKPLAGDWWPPSRLLPRSIIAVEDCSKQVVLGTPEWRRVCGDIGQDGGVFGIVDVAHFGDASVIPPGHPSLHPHPEFGMKYAWYDFVCEILGKSDVAIIPHGVMVHWDGGMDVDSLTVQNEVVAIRVSISEWPYPYGKDEEGPA